MPELPEVQTIVDQLNKGVKNRKITDVSTDKKKLIRNISFENFKKNIKNKKILEIERRGKYIIITLSDNFVLLVHLKMTGHFLLGKDFEDKYIHLIFYLDNKKQLAFSDVRQFARIEFYTKKEFKKLNTINELGIEPLSEKFTLKRFEEVIRKKNVNIKKILMDQKMIAGIGNIYASEILFKAKVSPKRNTKTLSEKEIKEIHKAIKFILNKSLKLKGDSVSDYKQLDGTRGDYQNYAKVYRKKKCSICKRALKYIKINQRGTYYCPHCQK